MKRRQAWFDRQLNLAPDRLVFIDETWASNNMARRYGRAPRGQRLRMSVPHGHWTTTTFIAGLRNTGMVAPFVIDGPVNREVFELYVEKILVPELHPGDVVVMDNLSSHKGPAVREMIRAAGARLLYLPPSTAPTSIRSRKPSPSSRLRSARPPSAPSTGCGIPSACSSTPSRPLNAPTTSPPAATMQTDGIPL